MGFVIGLLLGFNGALGLLIFLFWLALMRANKEAAAKFLQGCALVLTYKKPPVLVENSKNGEKEPMGFRLKSRKTDV